MLAAVLEAAAQPILVVDPDGVIRFANPAAVAALGYDSASELLGLSNHETIRFRRDGSKLSVGFVSVPIEMREGRGAVVAVADIEDRLGTEQALGERDAVLGAREDSL